MSPLPQLSLIHTAHSKQPQCPALCPLRGALGCHDPQLVPKMPGSSHIMRGKRARVQHHQQHLLACHCWNAVMMTHGRLTATCCSDSPICSPSTRRISSVGLLSGQRVHYSNTQRNSAVGKCFTAARHSSSPQWESCCCAHSTSTRCSFLGGNEFTAARPREAATHVERQCGGGLASQTELARCSSGRAGRLFGAFGIRRVQSRQAGEADIPPGSHPAAAASQTTPRPSQACTTLARLGLL